MDINECESQPCKNGGHCEDGQNSYECACAPGYTGRQCEAEIDECQSSPCMNSAVCENQINNYRCKCNIGFTGNNCEINIDDCANAPCANGGTCIDKLNTFECRCADGYAGKSPIPISLSNQILNDIDIRFHYQNNYPHMIIDSIIKTATIQAQLVARF